MDSPRACAYARCLQLGRVGIDGEGQLPAGWGMRERLRRGPKLYRPEESGERLLSRMGYERSRNTVLVASLILGGLTCS